MRRSGWCGMACAAAASLALQACATSGPAAMRAPPPPGTGSQAQGDLASSGDHLEDAPAMRLDAALVSLSRQAGRLIALDPTIDGATLVDVPAGPWPEALQDVAHEVEADVEPCGEVVFVIACGGPHGADGDDDAEAWISAEEWDEVAVEVLFGAIVGHDEESLGLELDDGQLMVVRLPAPDHAALPELLDVLGTAQRGDRVALRVRWGPGEEPTLEAFVGDDAAPVEPPFGW